MKEKKELIREAAVKVIAQEGFYNTKIFKIAEEAGVAVGTIYNYFDSKDQILEYIFNVEFTKRINLLEELKNKKMSIKNKLKIFIEKHFKEIKENLDTAQILVREKEFPKSSEFSAILNYLNEIPLLMEDMLDKAVKNGEIKNQNTAITAGLIFGALQGVVEKALRTNDIKLLDAADQEVIRFIEEGV